MGQHVTMRVCVSVCVASRSFCTQVRYDPQLVNIVNMVWCLLLRLVCVRACPSVPVCRVHVCVKGLCIVVRRLPESVCVRVCVNHLSVARVCVCVCECGSSSAAVPLSSTLNTSSCSPFNVTPPRPDVLRGLDRPPPAPPPPPTDQWPGTGAGSKPLQCRSRQLAGTGGDARVLATGACLTQRLLDRQTDGRPTW